ncbi:MAG: hypothetical protein ABII07_02865 [Patescibacteria group bacterium]|nr:hypothetical protein [Patescibacteria group bacterium]
MGHGRVDSGAWISFNSSVTERVKPKSQVEDLRRLANVPLSVVCRLMRMKLKLWLISYDSEHGELDRLFRHGHKIQQ